MKIQALDGRALAGRLFKPEAPSRGPVVVLHGAMGVPQGFYGRLATYLAGQGLPAFTYDYRGIGASLSGSVANETADLVTWAEQDMAGAIAWARDRWPERRLVGLGHSLAGQIFGLAPNRHEVEALATVASVKGYHGLWPWHRRALLLALWYGLVPVLVRMFGYFPARFSGLGGEDLPGPAALQWARWGKSPHYLSTPEGTPLHDGHASYEGRLLAVSLEDDWYAPENAVAALVDLYSAATAEHRHVRPTDRGVEAIGHFGAMREPGQRAGLWEDLVAWLREG